MVLTALDQLFAEEQIQVVPGEFHPLGNNGQWIAYPDSEKQISTILQYANEHGLKVVPMGGGTKRGFGGTEEQADLLLSLSRHRGIVEYSKGDLTITVKAGTTMKEIGDYLKMNKQMLPIDPAWPEFATIGGVVAANDSGPKRLRYGSARDLLIGLRLIYPNGQVIRTGGKVVKNVAGYDMNKLFVGSMGTLAVISELTLKLRPCPAYKSLAILAFPDGDWQAIRSFATAILDSQIEPVSLEVLSPSLNERLHGMREYGLVIAFEDVEKAVQYQVEWLKRHLPKNASLSVLSQDEADLWWDRFARISPKGAHPGSAEDQEIGLKVGSKNLDAIEVVSFCHQLGQELQAEVIVHGGAGHGISRAYVKGEESKLLPFVQAVRSHAESRGGYAVVQHAPLSLRQKVDVWGEKPAYFPLLEGIKRTVDPHSVLNPKRFIGGI
ncbi:FAD-binding oxidoreductase [Brevibacillus massiliensis]|uniref:FAD-binding oxidoreductase n=1 Tax=Brevibacillus massiliensis TaxID=1118054 RepID=UPI0002FE53FE|nr:FAD-binding oxidoreductase [Brevibacillus massiliensis]